ncbi:MAG: hypothetical protein AB7I33_06315 [Gemmatimonadales bacterium]
MASIFFRPVLGLSIAMLFPAAASLAAQERCQAGPSGDAAAWIERAIDATRMSRVPSITLDFVDIQSQNFQSDRSYPPFFVSTESGTLRFTPSTGTELRTSEQLYIASGLRPSPTMLSNRRATYRLRDSVFVPFPGGHGFFTARSRPLNAWAVLLDWRDAPGVRVVGRCFYRDYWRTVLHRTDAGGMDQRLFLDARTAFPVKLDWTEPDGFGLWGSRQVEYLYTNWYAIQGALYPMSSFRIVDGEPELTRNAAGATADGVQAPDFVIPDTADMSRAPGPAAMFPPPDTVRVGPNTFLLTNPIYTNVVALARDTVFILDAQAPGEARARQDSSWIARLFPGRHPFVLVVTDLAWPHISGVRFWVATGATVVSHPASRGFLARVIERRWTGDPDKLEQNRRNVRWRFVPVADSLSLGGGAVRLYPIDGIGSEGALMAWLPADGFLYPGDFIQDATAPSAYASEVWRAVRRVGVRPARTAAMHLPLTPWSTVDSLVGRNEGP